MAITDLNVFLCDYFTAKNCSIIENKDGILQIQLNEHMDRELMNRPFYWHYIKKMGREGDPMQLTLITNPNKRDAQGEWIHFGSPRLQQIMNHLKSNERFTKLFQKVETTAKTPLYPWLIMNIKISYQGQHKKDEIISIGLHLVNGKMKLNVMEELGSIDLQTTISDYCFTLSPIIRLKSGYLRIENVLSSYIDDQEHSWAAESMATLHEEIRTLKHFYEGENNTERMENEIEELTEKYQPRISMNVINGGIFYLKENTL